MRFGRLSLFVFACVSGLSIAPCQAQQSADDARTMKPGQMIKIERECCAGCWGGAIDVYVHVITSGDGIGTVTCRIFRSGPPPPPCPSPRCARPANPTAPLPSHPPPPPPPPLSPPPPPLSISPLPPISVNMIARLPLPPLCARPRPPVRLRRGFDGRSGGA